MIEVLLDTVNHKLLFSKLCQYGICGNVFTWYECYLTSIYQYVLFNGNKSDIRDVTCGVSQGSIFCPLLFILYINDKLFDVFFPDDTNVFLNG